jgi:copper homeostasis protein
MSPAENSESPLMVEVCIGSLADAQVVCAAGFSQVELNQGLPLGGLTPSAALVETVLGLGGLQVIAMVRPRAGGFCYSAEDWLIAKREAQMLVRQGVTGLAIGMLTAQREIAVDRVKELRQLFPETQLVFHRAFDLLVEWREGLEALAAAQWTRVLTSGQAATAWEGRHRLREMQELGLPIEILMGSGVRSENARELIAATGIKRIHGTFSESSWDPGYSDGPWRFAPNDDWRQVSRVELQRLSQELNRCH